MEEKYAVFEGGFWFYCCRLKIRRSMSLILQTL